MAALFTVALSETNLRKLPPNTLPPAAAVCCSDPGGRGRQRGPQRRGGRGQLRDAEQARHRHRPDRGGGAGGGAQPDRGQR